MLEGLDQGEDLEEINIVEDEDEIIELEDDTEEEEAEESPEDPTEEASEEDIPEEAKQIIEPQNKPKTQKRIISLVKQVNELKRKLERVEMSESSRSAKESEQQNQTKLSDLQQQRNKAMDDGDHDTLNRLDLEIHDALQTRKPVRQIADPDAYFSQKNAWYNNDSLDRNFKKTRYAKTLSQEVYSDSKYSHLDDSQKLDLIAKQTNEAFKTNPYKTVSPTEGVSMGKSTKKTIQISRSDLEIVKKMYPGYTQQQLLKEARDLKKGMGS